MKFTMRKLTMFLLVMLAALVLVGCDDPESDVKKPTYLETSFDEVAEIVVGKENAVTTDSNDAYTQESTDIYNANLGQYYSYYQEAKKEKDVSRRYALMAIAEAKLLESGLFIPLSSQGGNYAISRAVPYSASPVLWGNDGDRYHNMLVTTEFITVEDRTALKAHYSEVKGQGTYYAWAKEYLEGKGYTFTDVYNMAYSSDPQTWDVLNTDRSADSEAIVNTYDGLVEYDYDNNIQPALAESWEVSTDGKTYTFKLREGVKWVNYQGSEVAEVTADDFVAGMQHVLDAQGGLEYIVEGVIVNASEYINGKVTDFTKVGVKAVSKYEVQYTLCDEIPYFMTMLGYGIFAPMCREYYASQGGQFGADFDASAESYIYGKTFENIAYCGPYLVSEATAESTIKFVANPTYWNAENISIHTLTWKFASNDDPTKTYEDAKKNVLSGAGLNASALALAKTEKPSGQDKTYFELYGYVGGTDATTFGAYFNLNRKTYALADGTLASVKTDAQNQASKAAFNNVYFRLALCMSLDRATYNAQTVGEELKLTSLRNSYTPGTFVKLEKAVTVSINGVEKTYAAGTNYGVIVQDQIDADGLGIIDASKKGTDDDSRANYVLRVYDPTADDGAGSSDGYDGWYNPQAAKAYLNKAMEQLSAQGVVITAENPIVVDLPAYAAYDVYKNRASAFAQSVFEVTEGRVKFNLIECSKANEWYMCGYFCETGADNNYDMYDVSGWGPDYGDPSSYLDTMLPLYAGAVTKQIGVY